MPYSGGSEYLWHTLATSIYYIIYLRGKPSAEVVTVLMPYAGWTVYYL